MSQSDVIATTFVAGSSPGTAVDYRARVRSLYYVAGSSAGTIVLKDGASGDTLLTVATAATDGAHNVVVPDQGVLFPNEIHCTLTNVVSVTIFHS